MEGNCSRKYVILSLTKVIKLAKMLTCKISLLTGLRMKGAETGSFHSIDIFKYNYDLGLQPGQIVHLENFLVEGHPFSIIGIVIRRDYYLSNKSLSNQEQDNYEIIITVDAPDDRDKILEIANILKQSDPHLFEE